MLIDRIKMRTLKARCLLALIIYRVTLSPAFSQQLPNATPGTQTDVVDSHALPKLVSDNLIETVPGLATAPPADADAKIFVSKLIFSGNTAQASEILAPLVASYLGKAWTLSELNAAADTIRRHYRSQGWFLAQTYLPPQAGQNGVIEIVVLEGRIDAVTIVVAADAPLSAAYATKLVSNYLQAGQALTENDLERPLLLLRDVPRIDAKSVIEPGTVAGTASILVNVIKDVDVPCISGTLGMDNFGSRVAGTNRVSSELTLNNPYGWGDQLSLHGFLSNLGGNGFGRAAYYLPIGPWGNRVGVSVARLDYVLGQEFAALEPNGVADVLSMNASQPLIRRKDANLSAQLFVEKKNLTDRTTTPSSSELSTLSSLRVLLNGDQRDNLAGVNLYSLSLMSGELRLESAVRQAIDADPTTGAHAAGRFAKLVYSLQRFQQFAPGLHGLLSLSGQLCNKNLHSAEKFSIGGDSTVRAFPVGELVGDEGYTASAELRYGVPQLKIGQLDTVTTLFYDYGHVTQNHDNQLLKNLNNERSIAGYGLGLNLGYGERYLIKIALAWPVSGDTVDPAKQGRRLWGQASYSF